MKYWSTSSLTITFIVSCHGNSPLVPCT